MSPHNVTHYLHTFPYGKINLLYININSLRNKIEEIEIMLGSHGNKIIHFIALAEIRIKQEENNKYCIKGYTEHFSNRDDGHGGVALYVHDSFISCLIESECNADINFLRQNLW